MIARHVGAGGLALLLLLLKGQPAARLQAVFTLAAMLKAMAGLQAGGTPLASSLVWRLPSGPGPQNPEVFRTS